MDGASFAVLESQPIDDPVSKVDEGFGLTSCSVDKDIFVNETTTKGKELENFFQCPETATHINTQAFLFCSSMNTINNSDNLEVVKTGMHIVHEKSLEDSRVVADDSNDNDDVDNADKDSQVVVDDSNDSDDNDDVDNAHSNDIMQNITDVAEQHAVEVFVESKAEFFQSGETVESDESNNNSFQAFATLQDTCDNSGGMDCMTTEMSDDVIDEDEFGEFNSVETPNNRNVSTCANKLYQNSKLSALDVGVILQQYFPSSYHCDSGVLSKCQIPNLEIMKIDRVLTHLRDIDEAFATSFQWDNCHLIRDYFSLFYIDYDFFKKTKKASLSAFSSQLGLLEHQKLATSDNLDKKEPQMVSGSASEQYLSTSSGPNSNFTPTYALDAGCLDDPKKDPPAELPQFLDRHDIGLVSNDDCAAYNVDENYVEQCTRSDPSCIDSQDQYKNVKSLFSSFSSNNTSSYLPDHCLTESVRQVVDNLPDIAHFMLARMLMFPILKDV